MKSNLLFITIFLLSNWTFSQPVPTKEQKIERIHNITKALKKDSTNYILRWEKLNLNLDLHDLKQLYEPFNIHPKFELTKKQKEEFEKEYNCIHNQLILQNFDTNIIDIERGDFYLSRIMYYGITYQYENAINDAIYLNNNSESRYWLRNEYYKKASFTLLFNLYVLTNKYEKALETINQQCEEFGNNKYWLYKVNLFEHYNKIELLFPYLKNVLFENFDDLLQKSKSAEFNGSLSNIEKKDINKRDLDTSLWNKKISWINLFENYVYYVKKYNYKSENKYLVAFEKINQEKVDITFKDLEEIMRR